MWKGSLKKRWSEWEYLNDLDRKNRETETVVNINKTSDITNRIIWLSKSLYSWYDDI